MTAQPGVYQASHNSGELAPELYGRTDVKQYYSGLSRALNIEPVPQGGGRLSPRSRYLGRVRPVLEDIDIEPTFNAGPWEIAAVIAVATFAATPLSAIMVEDFASTVTLGTILQFEYRDAGGSDWHAIGVPFAAGTAAKTRIAALAPGETVMATGVRLNMAENPPEEVSFTIPEFRALVETADLSAVRLRPFTFALDQTYVGSFTAGHVDLWRDGTFVGAAHTGLTGAQLELFDTQQRFDTMLLFHPDVAPLRIMRDASDGLWPRDAIPFSNIPQVDLGGTYDNAVTDIWKIYLRYPTSGTYANGNNLFVSIEVNGEETPGIGTGATVNWPDFAAAVKAALEALPSIEEGLTVTEDHSTSGLTVITVEFSGAGNAGTLNALTARVVNTGDAAATATHTQIGVPGGEPLIGETAGWQRCAAFFNDRLIAGGFRSKRSALLASVSADYFNLNTEIASASGALLANLDTDGAEELHRIARARHLMLFTTDAEYFITDRALSRTTVPNIVNCSRNGSATGVPVVESSDGVLYVSRNRGMLYAATYDDVSQAYVSDPISLLASHIVSGIVDMALQRAATATDANRLWMVRADGTMTLAIMIRAQDVTAFVRWQTDGEVKAVCVDGQSVPHIVVARDVDGAPQLFLERLESGLIFDATVTQTFEAPVETVGNLAMHESKTVWAQADGYVVGPFTVAGGEITLPFAATEVSVGRWTAPDARLLPLPSEIAERTVLKRPKRVHGVKIDLIDTTSLAIGANGEAATDVPLTFSGAATDAPPAPFTGQREIDGIDGYSDEGIVQVTQVRPGALQWRGITVEARV